MDYLGVKQFETYVAACAKNSSVTVVWDSADSIPRTNNKTMWLPKLTSKTSEEWLKRIRYYVKHETSHIVSSDFDFLNKVRPKGLLMLINNLIEDHRIDYLNDAEYAGDRAVSDDYWQLYTDDVIKRAAGTDKVSEQQNLVLPLFVWESSLRDWIPSSRETSIAMEKMLDADGIAKLDKLIDYSKELLVTRESGTAQDVWDLSVKILKEVFDKQPEDYQEPDKAKGDAKAEDDGADSDGDDVSMLKDLLETMGHSHTKERGGDYVPTERSVTGVYELPRPDEYKILRFPKLNSCVDGFTDEGLDKAAVTEYVTSNARHMANKLRIKLQTRSRDRYEYGLKKGKLHNGSVHRLLSGDVNNAQRVFRQKKVNTTLDTAVCLLVDCSGSMSGAKYQMACAGAGTFSAALKPLNIAHSVLGFTNTKGHDDPMVWVFSDYNERVSETDLIRRFSRASACLWENTDGDAIAYAYAMLAARKEKRKVLLVLSDGDPAGRGHKGNITQYTKDMVKKVEDSNVDIYGIGIMHDSVKRFYKNYKVVSDLNELTPTILNILDRSI